LFEHDLFGKPVPTHRVVARGHAFPDHALDRDEMLSRLTAIASKKAARTARLFAALRLARLIH